MNEIIQRIAAAAGLDEGLAGKAVGMILGFLNKEGPKDAVGEIMAQFPGADALIADAQQGGGGGGLMGSLMGMASGGGGIMALGSQMMGAGLSMGQATGVGKELFAVAREKVGDETVGKVVASIPGLSQFI
jgi:hypothetical protein